MIYIIKCQNCRLQYVWKSETTFNRGLNNHRNHIKGGVNSCELSEHFLHNSRSYDLSKDVTITNSEQTKQSNMTIKRRWNLIFYRIPEFSGEDCALLVKNVLTDNLKLEEAEVRSMKFCGVHRIGQHRRSKIRPIIVRFTCRADRDKVWKCRYALKHSSVSVGEDLPKAIQDIRAKVLLPAMKKAKETPSTKATIVGDRLIVNGKSYFHYQIPEKWQVNQQVPQQQVEEQGES